MYLLTASLHKEPLSNSKHASIDGPTTVNEVWKWSWPNLRYYCDGCLTVVSKLRDGRPKNRRSIFDRLDRVPLIPRPAVAQCSGF